MYADSDLELGKIPVRETVAHPDFEFLRHLPHCRGSAQRARGMIRERVGHAKFGHYRVSNELVYSAAFGPYDVDDPLKVDIKEFDCFVRAELLSNSGEITYIGEQHRDMHRLAAHVQLLAAT